MGVVSQSAHQAVAAAPGHFGAGLQIASHTLLPACGHPLYRPAEPVTDTRYVDQAGRALFTQCLAQLVDRAGHDMRDRHFALPDGVEKLGVGHHLIGAPQQFQQQGKWQGFDGNIFSAHPQSAPAASSHSTLTKR